MRDTWAPPVGLCAPPVLYGSLWPPCTGWCPGSSHSHWSGRGGWGSVCQWVSVGCWSWAQLEARGASTDDCRSAWPWSAQIPQSNENTRAQNTCRYVPSWKKNPLKLIKTLEGSMMTVGTKLRKMWLQSVRTVVLLKATSSSSMASRSKRSASLCRYSNDASYTTGNHRLSHIQQSLWMQTQTTEMLLPWWPSPSGGWWPAQRSGNLWPRCPLPRGQLPSTGASYD